jgi:hypothetical protein
MMVIYRLTRFYMREGTPLIPAVKRAFRAATRGF